MWINVKLKVFPIILTVLFFSTICQSEDCFFSGIIVSKQESFIIYVFPGSLAEVLGFKKADTVISINHVCFDFNQSFKDVWTSFSTKQQYMSISILRRSRHFTIKVKPEILKNFSQCNFFPDKKVNVEILMKESNMEKFQEIDKGILNYFYRDGDRVAILEFADERIMLGCVNFADKATCFQDSIILALFPDRVKDEHIPRTYDFDSGNITEHFGNSIYLKVIPIE